jgi:hypothetical protein
MLDANDRIPYASAVSDLGQAPDPKTEPYAWLRGLTDFNPSNPSNWDVEKDIKKSPLWPYVGGAAGLWKCPADNSSIVPAFGPLKGKRVRRVRSISMSIWLGGFGGRFDVGGLPDGLKSPPWRLYLGLNDLVEPGPPRRWCFVTSEKTRSMPRTFYRYDRISRQAECSAVLGRFAASYHHRAGGLSLRTAMPKSSAGWTAAMPPVRKDSNWLFTNQRMPSPNNKDIIWLRERATRRINNVPDGLGLTKRAEPCAGSSLQLWSLGFSIRD